MTKRPVKHAAAELEMAAEGGVTAAQPSGGGFSFHYSYREVPLSGDTTRIRSREHRFEDGKLWSDEFDTTTDPAVYRNGAKVTQELVMDRVDSFVKLFSAFLPFSRAK